MLAVGDFRLMDEASEPAYVWDEEQGRLDGGRNLIHHDSPGCGREACYNTDSVHLARNRELSQISGFSASTSTPCLGQRQTLSV